MIKRALLIGTAALALVGLIYQTVATEVDRRRFSPPGRLIDVGGYRLHLQVMGDGQPGPTVLLEAGMASFSTNWYWVQTTLATASRVVATIVLVSAGVTPGHGRATLDTALKSCIERWWAPGLEDRMSWSGTRTAGWSCAPSRTSIQMKLWAWSWSTPRIRTSGHASPPR
jgi:hypothetical protein